MTVPIPVPLSRNVTVPVGAPPAEVVTVAVNVTACPPTAGLSDEVSAVDVARGLMVSATAEELLGAKFVSPEYCAKIECEPVVSEEIVNAACPALAAPVPSDAPLSKKLTLPDGVPVAVLLTVAVSVIGCPKIEELCGEASVTVVFAVPGGNAVTKMACRALPPLIPAQNANLPASPEARCVMASELSTPPPGTCIARSENPSQATVSARDKQSELPGQAACEKVDKCQGTIRT